MASNPDPDITQWIEQYTDPYGAPDATTSLLARKAATLIGKAVERRLTIELAEDLRTEGPRTTADLRARWGLRTMRAARAAGLIDVNERDGTVYATPRA